MGNVKTLADLLGNEFADLMENETDFNEPTEDDEIRRLKEQLAAEKAKNKALEEKKQELENSLEQKAEQLMEAQNQLKNSGASRCNKGKNVATKEELIEFWVARQEELKQNREKKQQQNKWEVADEFIASTIQERIDSLCKSENTNRASLKDSKMLADIITANLEKVYALCNMTSTFGINAYNGYLNASARVCRLERELFKRYSNYEGYIKKRVKKPGGSLDTACGTCVKVMEEYKSTCEELGKTCESLKVKCDNLVKQEEN